MTQRHGGIVGKDYDAAKQTTTTFTSNGIFTPHTTQDVDFLCIGGGGAGAGSSAGAGGGGAGGYRSSWQEDPDTHTQLLIQSDTTDGSTTFTDSSSTGHTLTIYGNMHHETDQYKFGTTAIAFDGTGDFATIPAHSDFYFGTGPYTIECWIKTAGTQQGSWIINQAANDTGIRFCIGSNGSGSGAGVVQMNEQVSNGDNYTNGSTTVNDDAWHHIVVTRGDAGSATKIYVDGKLDATGNTHSRSFDNDNVMYLGTRQGFGGNYFNGYIEELRISNSQRYSRNFTVPTGPFPLKEDPLALTKGTDYQITVGDGGIGGDETNWHYGYSPQRILSGTSRGYGQGHDSAIGPYTDSYTKLMLQSYTSDGSTTFTDLSDSAHTITVTGNVHHEEDQHKDFHPGAIYFDGTGDYLSLPTSSDWAMGTGDFTIECWFRQDASPSGKQAIFDTRISSRDETTGFSFGIHNNGSFYIYNAGDIPVSTSGLISANTWYHVAVARQHGKYVLYLDGVWKSNATPTERNFTNTQAKIGVRPDNSGELFKGYLDELRVSKGIARYQDALQPGFTPPYDTLNRIVSIGGGRGGGGGSNAGWYGGSGGGGTYTSGGGYGIEQQGYDGSISKYHGASAYGGGGGGGASAAATPSTGTGDGISSDTAGDGGAGRASTITGSSVTRAGGGGGGQRLAMTNAPQKGDGGAGGGGDGQGGGTHGTNGAGGTQGNGEAATANTGSGGGGSGGQGNSQYGRYSDTGGSGGSGVVIMRESAANSGVWNMDDVFRYVSDGKW